jgi:uncharacterized protein YdiU (UPF0061 family)
LISDTLKKFSDLAWDSRFVEGLPGDEQKGNFIRTVHKVCFSEVHPAPVQSPKLVGWANSLAADLGILRPTSEDLSSLQLLAGNQILPKMRPYAARYAGHQFGNWAGQLGDGRAITLGEVELGQQGRLEFQLKGAGPTPYSRRGDGRAVLRSSMREFLCSEAMHFLGVPTTRALSLVTTGEPVVRDLFYDGNAKAEPGAIVCRVAPSFLRFGNFQILAANQEVELLKRLTDFLIQEHFQDLKQGDSDIYGKLLDEVARRTALMVAHWMRVGFVHGVMNTDNMSVLGLTIDYGPYGWLEPYDPTWTPNTTDAQTGRYQFGQQPSVALWNLARFGEALFPLLQDVERIHTSLAIFREEFERSYGKMLCQKLGLSTLESQQDQGLVESLFELLQSSETDFTLFFRKLCDWRPGCDAMKLIAPAFYSAPSNSRETSMDSALREKWLQWFSAYSEKLKQEGTSDDQRSLSMKSVNPKYVLRNYLAQNAIYAAENGDYSVMERLMKVLQTPYEDHPSEEDLALKRPEWARHAPGCSALSCSS